MNIEYNSELVNAIVDMLNELSKDISSSRDEINVLINSLKAMEEQLNLDITKLTTQKEQLEKMIPKLESELESAAQAVAACQNPTTPEEESALSAAQDHYSAVAEQLQNVRQTLAAAIGMINTKQAQLADVKNRITTCQEQIQTAERYQLLTADTISSIRFAEENILNYSEGVSVPGIPFIITNQMRLDYENEYRSILEQNYLLQGLNPKEAHRKAQKDAIPSFEDAYRAAIKIQVGQNTTPAQQSTAANVFSSPIEQQYVEQYRELLKSQLMKNGMSEQEAIANSKNAMPPISYEEAKKLADAAIPLQKNPAVPPQTVPPQVVPPQTVPPQVVPPQAVPSHSGNTISLSGNRAQTGNIGRTPVFVSEQELRKIASIVQNEARIEAGRDGSVAVAEEIRNRVAHHVGGNNVDSILYDGYEKWAGGHINTNPPQEVIELCRNVFNGTEWYFNDDMVLSHASHQTYDRNHVYQHQSGISGTSPADSFYYSGIHSQQTFYRWEHL